MEKFHWSIELKQVSNGYLLKIVDQSRYDVSETVHPSVDDAVTAMRTAMKHLESKLPLLSAGVVVVEGKAE